MSDEQRLRTVKKMINAGMYDEARAALLTIDHPMADKWLKKLNQISPPTHKVAPRNKAAIRKNRSKNKPKPKPDVQDIDDFYADEPVAERSSTASTVVVIAVLVVIGMLLVGGAFMLTQGGDFIEPVITTDNTGCGGQEWVNSIDGTFNELYRYSLWDMLYFQGEDGSLLLDESLRDTQINELEARMERVENTTVPDCVANVRDKIIEAYESQIRATQILRVDDPINAFGSFGKTLRLMKEAANELIELGAQFRRIDSAAINQLVDPDCPAFEYVTRTMYVDNQFVVILLVDPQIQSLDAYYSYIRDLAQQYYRVLDDPTVDSCLWAVRDQFVIMIDGFKSALEAISGNDLYGFESHMKRYDEAFDQFYIELEKAGLDPTQFGSYIDVR